MQIYTKCTGFTKLPGISVKRSRGWTGSCRGGKVARKIVGKLMGNSRKSYREEKNARDWTHKYDL